MSPLLLKAVDLYGSLFGDTVHFEGHDLSRKRWFEPETAINHFTISRCLASGAGFSDCNIPGY